MRNFIVVAAAFVTAMVATAAPRPKAASGTDRTVTNPAKDIYVVTDRDETAKEFFNRNRIVVGSAAAERGPTVNFVGLAGVLEATEPLKLFVSHPSQNDEVGKLLFGASLRVAPPAPEVVKMFKELKSGHSVVAIFRRDKDNLHHLVGYTARQRLDFFHDDTPDKPDGFSPNDLRFIPEKN